MPPYRDDYRARLLSFYETHNPSKISDIDLILESFAGDEEGMLNALHEKYGVLPLEPNVEVGEALEAQRDAAAAISDVPAGAYEEAMKSPRRARGEAVSSRGGMDAAIAAVQRTKEGSKASLQHLHQRLQGLLASMVQVDPTELLLAFDRIPLYGSGSEDHLAGILRDVSRFKSLAAEFVDECAPLIEIMESNGFGTRDDARRAVGAQQSGARAVDLSAVAEDATAVDGSIVILPPQRNAEGRSEENGVITARLTSLAEQSSLGQLAKFVLHPGVYPEQMMLPDGAVVELRGSYVGASITLQHLCASVSVGELAYEPIISVGSGATLRCYGMRFTTASETRADAPDGAAGGAATLIRVTGAGSRAEFVNCVFEHTAIGALVEGVGVTTHFVDCKFTDCSYAGIYAKHGSIVSLEGCQFLSNQCSLRCRGAAFSLVKCVVTHSTGDALITHGTAEGSIEGTMFEGGLENGLLLSPSTSLQLRSSSFSAFRMFAVYAAKGADVTVLHCTFHDNGLGSLNAAAHYHRV
jgi:hypothetical protein